jgi:hypothetical protein
MMNRITALSPRLKVRIAGVCYLMTIATGAFDHLSVSGRLIAPADAVATAHNIMASAQLYRLAFALDLIPFYAVVTVLFYDLFKPVNHGLSLLAACFSLMGGAVGAVLGVFQLAPLIILGGAPYLRALDTGQLQALAMLFLKLHELGFTISLVFFGFYCFLLGWLMIASSFIPRPVGVLMGVAGLAYIAYSFTDFVSPPLAAGLSSSAVMLGGLGEAALTLWLLAGSGGATSDPGGIVSANRLHGASGGPR